MRTEVVPIDEKSWSRSVGRRRALHGLSGFLAGSTLLRSQHDPYRDQGRVPGLDELKTVFDFEAAAYAKWPRETFDFTAHGGDSEFTLRRNREAFEWVELVRRGVADVSTIQTATEVLGTKMAFPIMVSPTSGHGLLYPDGEKATHVGATSASATPMILSNATSFPVEQVAAAATGPMWFQLYPKPTLDANREVLDKALAAGYRAVCVTVDQQAASYDRTLHDRNMSATNTRLARRRAAIPQNRYHVEEYRLWYDWKIFDELRPVLKVPLLAKGVLTAEDAKLCIEHGLDGVYVSNHGGRSLDYGPSTLEVLPEIVDAVHGRIPVLIDSGFRRGSDILKGLALGASAVCVGRASRWGLGSFGAPGVQRVLEVLQGELVQAMAATGTPSLAAINSSLVRTNFL